MSIGIIGKKLGMTSVFDKDGQAVPVTVIQADPCVVVQVRTKEKEGYNAVQIGFDAVAEKKLSKPENGHFKKAGTKSFRTLKEFKVADASAFTLGQEIKAEEIFKEGDKVDAIGVSIGKGFQGPVKKYHFARGRMTHGSQHHRIPGSSGSGTTPGRVLPGMRRASQMGNVQVTVKNLAVVQIRGEKNLILVKGAVPGAEGTMITLRKSREKWNA